MDIAMLTPLLSPFNRIFMQYFAGACSFATEFEESIAIRSGIMMHLGSRFCEA